MCRVIAVSNQKGGVGKTVSCVNLGIGLAQEGKKVLLIDADPQGSLTISLGYDEPDEMEYSLATLILNVVNDEKLNMEKTILHHREGVDLIPANIELSAIEVSLVNAMSRELLIGIFDLILETVLCKNKSIIVASSEYPAELVRSKFLKLNMFHVEYAMDCMRKNTSKIHNIKKYLLAALFNAPSTISGYYQAEVNHDLPQYAANDK